MDTQKLDLDKSKGLVVDDVTLIKDKSMKDTKYFLISEKRSKYIKLSKEQYTFFEGLIPLLKKEKIEEVKEFLHENSTISYEKMRTILSKHNLCTYPNTNSQSNIEFELNSRKLFEIPLFAIQKRIERVTKGIYYLNLLLIAVMLIGFPIIIIKFPVQLIDSYISQINFSILNVTKVDIIVILFAGSGSLVFHELGHLLSSNYYNVEWKSLNIRLKWGFSPVIYIRYSDMYTIDSWKRVKILGFGMINNCILIFFSLCLFIITNNWWFGYIALLNIGYLFSSLLPLSTSDGYHIFTIIYGSEGTRWQLLLLLAGVIKKETSILKKFQNKKMIGLFLYFILSYVIGIAGIFSIIRITLNYLNVFGFSSTVLSIFVYVMAFISLIQVLLSFKKALKSF